MCQPMQPGDIIHLNVGGTKFATSRQTLTWVPDSFFTSMLSGRIPILKDDGGSIFIDRDPKLFNFILNFLRTKDIDLNNVEISSLRHEAEFYGIAPLVNRLTLCEDLDYSSCGNVFFQGYLVPPGPPSNTKSKNIDEKDNSGHELNALCHSGDVNLPNPGSSSFSNIHPRLVFRVSAVHSHQKRMCQSWTSLDLQSPHSILSCKSSDIKSVTQDHTRASSLDLKHFQTSSVDFSKNRTDSNTIPTSNGSLKCSDSYVRMIKGDHNWIAVSYAHFVCCYRLHDSCGWLLAFTSPYIEPLIERIALHAKVLFYCTLENSTKLLAISHGSQVRLWGIMDGGTRIDIGIFPLNVSVDHLFFIKRQLVALSLTGKIGVWHSTTQHWQIQDVVPITSFDTAGSFLLLGCKNGSIYYIDMQKFPLRMKDNDLLVTELYHDPLNDVITAIGVYLTPQTSLRGNWIEIAYGTSSGAVCVIVQHPETVGNEPQLFQTYTVHRSPVIKVALSEKYLISVCSEYNHVRTWKVNRFRGMISTQPGSTPLASFKVISLENIEPASSIFTHPDCGPYGQQDDEQVFIQKLVPETDQLYVRYASSGQRICIIKSVDGTSITTFCVHECEGSNRMGSRSKRCIITGHTSGAIQIWDLTTALDLTAEELSSTTSSGGPSPEEIINLLDHCDLTTVPTSIVCNDPLVASSINYKLK